MTEASDKGPIVGTEGYIPAEGPGSPQADLYSLGKVLYEAATGRDRRDYPALPDDLRSWPDANMLRELNAVILRACAQDPRERYVNSEAMLADFEILLRGKSVKIKRQRAKWWAVAKRIGMALTLLTILTGSASMLFREFKRRQSTPVLGPSPELGRVDEGPRSTNGEANALYANAMLIMRADDQKRMGEAYTNFLEATRLDPTFAKPY